MHTDYFKKIFWILFDLVEQSNKSKDLWQTTILISETIRTLKNECIITGDKEMFVSKKKYLALEKEFRDWKEGRKKTLFEQAGIYPPETIATLTEENRLLHQNNISLSEELEKYKKLYSDEVFNTIVLRDIIKNMEAKNNAESSN